MIDPQLHEIKPDVEIVAKAKQEYKLLGRIRLKRGHSLFAFNTKTAHLKKVELKREVMIGMTGETIKRSKAFQEPDTIYITALNAKNALKKVIRQFQKFKKSQS